jgi:predicted RND superfamily exporter protein
LDVIHLLWRWHWVILAGALLLTLLSLRALVTPGLADDFSLRTLAGSSDPKFDDLELFIDNFSGAEVTLIAVEAPSIMDRDVQEAMTELVESAEALPAVGGAASLTKVPRILRPMVANSRIAQGLLVSSDGTTAAIVLQMRGDDEVDVSRQQTLATLEQLVKDTNADHPELRAVMTGPYLISYEMTRIVWDDLRQFGSLGALISLLPLLLSLGSLRLAIYPLLVGIATVSMTLGLSILLGINTALNLPMLVLLTAVLTVSTCIHLAVGGRDQQGHEVTPTVRRMLRPCLGIVGTTIAGFAAVGISDIEPIRTFALLMSAGLAIGLCLSLVAAFIAVRRPRRRALLATPIERLLRLGLQLIERFPRSLVAGFLLLGVVGAACAGQLSFSLQFLENFRPGDPVRTNYEFVEQKLTPMQSIEVLVSAPAGQPSLTPQLLQGMSALAEEFEQEPAISRSLSLVDVFSFASSKLPATQSELDERLRLIESTLRVSLGENPLGLFLSSDRQIVRMSFIAYEGPTPGEKVALAERMQQRATELVGDQYKVTVTGLYPFYAYMAQRLLRDQVLSLLASVAGIYLIVAWTLRSWGLALLGMFPTAIAAATCVGLMVVFDVPFNMVTSMMLAIALGIAVDNTIHYLWHYRQQRERGIEPREAVASTHLTVGSACLLSSTVIALGFAAMSWSRFLPIAYFGGVTSGVMAIALAANLLFMPALLLLVDRRPWATTHAAS